MIQARSSFRECCVGNEAGMARPQYKGDDREGQVEPG
jgi:hypothetical protein